MARTLPFKLKLFERKVGEPGPSAIIISLPLFALAGLALFLSGVILLAFLLDLVGLPIRPWSVLPLALLPPGGLLFFQLRRVRGRPGPLFYEGRAEFFLFLFITLGLLAYLFWLGRPYWLPVGTTVDAVHQFGLANYILDAGRLPLHAPELRANLQDGLEYPPAFVTLAALAAGLFGRGAAYLLYPVAAGCVALSGGTTFLVAAWLFRAAHWRLPLAALCAGLLFLPYGYTFDSILSQNYFAMVLAELLLLLSLYFALRWWEKPRPWAALCLGAVMAALLVDYPTWALIPLAASAGLLALKRGLSLRGKINYLAAVGLPLAALALLFLKDRLHTGLGTVSNEGEVLQPDPGLYGWPVLALALLGAGAALRRKESRPLALFPGLLAGEAASFYLLKDNFGIGSYYSAYKLFYPASYLVALLAGLGLHFLLEKLPPRAHGLNFKGASRLALLAAFLIFGLALLFTWQQRPNPGRAYPVITRDMVNTGEWMARNLPVQEYSVGYGLPFGSPAYWIQVGFLKQPQDNRARLLLTGEPASFEQWFYNPQSESYFFTDKLSRVNLDERLKVLFQSGETGVITRTPAYTQERARRQSATMAYKAELDRNQINLTAESTFSPGPDHFMGLGLVLEPEAGGTPVYFQATPAEPDRDRKEYMGIRVLLPSLKTEELFTNGLFPPIKTFNPLTPGRYRAFIEVQKNGRGVERRPLFTFTYESGKELSFDPAQRIQQGQFLYDGPLASGEGTGSPGAEFEAGQNLPRLLGYSLEGEARAGETARLTLNWFNPAPQGRNFKVLLSLVDSEGRVGPESAALPLNGLFPTWFWPDNRPVSYTQALKLPALPGKYSLRVALQELETNRTTPFIKLDQLLEVK